MIFLGQSGFGGLGFGSLWAWGLGGGGTWVLVKEVNLSCHNNMDLE